MRGIVAALDAHRRRVLLADSGRCRGVAGLAMRLLIVEDDNKTARALQSGLRSEGFSVVLAHTGEEGFFLLSSESFDLIVLDWMLPGRDGIEILTAVRARGTKTPVLLLTARDAVADRVSDLRRVHSHLVTFAYPILNRIAQTSSTAPVLDLEALHASPAEVQDTDRQ